MKWSGHISLLVVLGVIITTLTFCDKKKSPEPVEPSPSKNDITNSAATATTEGNTTSRNTGVSNSSGESITIQLVTTGGSTTSKDGDVSNDPDGSNSQNTSLTVSTLLPGWTFDPCLLNPLQLTGKNGTTVVILTFGSVIANGNYTLTSGLPGIGQVKMTVLDPPGQPIGSIFVSKSGGTVSVNVGTSTTVAAFTTVQCTPLLFPYPVVTVSGDVGCN